MEYLNLEHKMDADVIPDEIWSNRNANIRRKQQA